MTVLERGEKLKECKCEVPRISSSEFKELLSEDMRRLFDDLVLNLMRYGGISKHKAEEIVLAEFIKIKNLSINYSAMSRVERESLAGRWALSILDEMRKKEENLISCKRCGAKTAPNSYWGYCDKCNEEFNIAIRNGALILYQPTFRESDLWEIRRYLPRKNRMVRVFYREYSELNQVQAIVKARRIAKNKRIHKILIEYLPNHTRWFLDEYLETHPKIKDAVLKAEEGIFTKIKKFFSIKGLNRETKTK